MPDKGRSRRERRLWGRLRPGLLGRLSPIGVALLVVSLLTPTALPLMDRGALAQAPGGTGGPPPTDLSPDKVPLPPKPRHPKLDSQLNHLVERAESRAAQAAGVQGPAAQGPPVAVTVRLSSNLPDVAAFLRARGGVAANVGTDYIEGYAPVALLAELGEQQGVLKVERIIPPVPSVTSQGTTVHRSPIWNTAGFTGAEVKVGIIDVGFEGFGALMGTELPASVTARCYTAVGVFTASLSDCQTEDKHGTGVAEAVMDMAPGASLYIANPFSPTDIQSTAAWMVQQGVKVINHSVGWIWQGPGDGTSPFSNGPLGAVDVAVAGGAIWVNAAGNEAEGTWYGSFSDPDGDSYLNFLGTDETNTITLSQGQSVVVQLRWEDSWSNAARDLDLLLFNSALAVVAASGQEQGGAAGQVPLEVLSYTAPVAGTYHVAISRFAGAVPGWVQLQMFDGPDLEYASAARSMGNPAESASAGMVAVGAARWSTTSTIESFSSQGPTTDGRVKPDIVGADGGASVTYGTSGFYGTSQAAPHVAGLAALVVQRFPSYSPSQVADYLRSNALPRGSPVPNNTWGYGLAQLPSLPPGVPTNVTAVAGDGQATVSWTAPTFDGGSPVTQYTATSSPGGVQTTVSAPSLSTGVTGLTNGTSYTFTVVATNAIGSSTPSAPSNAATPTPTPTPAPQPTATPTPAPQPTATPTPAPQPTATPTPAPQPTATPTPAPQPTATPTPAPQPPTPTPVPPTPTRTPAATPVPGITGGGIQLLAVAMGILVFALMWRHGRKWVARA